MNTLLVLSYHHNYITLGVMGEIGSTGTIGVSGDPGVTGILGTGGDKGEKGDLGIRGDQGTTGTTGEKGSNGTVGSPGTPGLTGAKGLLGYPFIYRSGNSLIRANTKLNWFIDFSGYDLLLNQEFSNPSFGSTKPAVKLFSF